MVWIEVHQSLPTHAKTIEMATFLDVPEVEVVGHLVCLWLWAVDNAQDGQVRVDKPVVLARAAQWGGEPGRFVDALLCAGFVDQDGRLHDWDDYTGRLMERRERIQQQTRARVQAFRQRRRAATGSPTPTITRGNAQSNALPSVTGNAGNAEVTLGNAPTGPNPTRFSPPTGESAPDADAPVARHRSRKTGKRLEESPTTEAVRAANVILHVRCDPVQREAINAIVPEAANAQATWETVLKAWRLRYPNNKSLEGPLDWFRVGIPPGRAAERARRNGTPVKRERTTFAQFAAGILNGDHAQQHEQHAEKGPIDEPGTSHVLTGHGPTDGSLPAPRRG